MGVRARKKLLERTATDQSRSPLPGFDSDGRGMGAEKRTEISTVVVLAFKFFHIGERKLVDWWLRTSLPTCRRADSSALVRPDAQRVDYLLLLVVSLR